MEDLAVPLRIHKQATDSKFIEIFDSNLEVCHGRFGINRF